MCLNFHFIEKMNVRSKMSSEILYYLEEIYGFIDKLRIEVYIVCENTLQNSMVFLPLNQLKFEFYSINSV